MYTLRFISTSRLLWIDLGSAQRHRLDESKHLRRLPHPLLEVQPLLDGHGVGLGDDGDDVDLEGVITNTQPSMQALVLRHTGEDLTLLFDAEVYFWKWQK